VKILALSNNSLYEKISRYKRKMEENVYESAEEIRKSRFKGERLK